MQMMKLPLLKEPALGAFLDLQASKLFILGAESLNLYTYCLRSKQLSSAARTYTDAINLLEVEQTVENLIQSNEFYFRMMKADDLNILNYTNFDKEFTQNKILKGLGTHQCLDFLNLSLTMPLVYSPQSNITKDYSCQLRAMMR